MTDAKELLTQLDCTILAAFDDGSEAWHEQRKQGIGGSDAATILGLQPYGSDRLTLWERKTDRQPPFVGNAATEYGSRLEAHIFERLEFLASASAAWQHLDGLVRCEYQLAHPEHDWMRANVDGLVVGAEPAGVEIKTSTYGYDGVHEYHYPQMQHYMAVTGAPRWHYVYFEVPFDRQCALEIDSLFIGPDDETHYWQWVVEAGELHTTTVERDDEYIGRLIDAEREFWKAVEEDTPPPDITPKDTIIVEDDRLQSWLDEYGQANAILKAAKSRPEVKEAKERKKSAKSAAKEYLASFRASGAKRVELPNGDYALWNARGYWQLKPQARDLDENKPF